MLELEKGAIESELGIWSAKNCQASGAVESVQYKDGDIEDRTRWPEYFRWLSERADAFHRVFSPRIKRLDLSSRMKRRKTRRSRHSRLRMASSSSACVLFSGSVR
jgi:hypothetical protein